MHFARLPVLGGVKVKIVA